MNIDEFNAFVDEIEIDPRPRLKTIAANLMQLELQSCIDDAQRQRFAASALKELAASAKDAIEGSNCNAIETYLVDFRMSLRRRMHYERTAGELRPVTPQSEIQRCGETLHNFLYRAAEIAALEAKMTNGEIITAITWGAIETARQVILRREMPSITRPVSFRDGNNWRSQFVSDAAVEAAQAEEQRRQAPVANRFGQPSKWIE